MFVVVVSSSFYFDRVDKKGLQGAHLSRGALIEIKEGFKNASGIS